MVGIGVINTQNVDGYVSIKNICDIVFLRKRKYNILDNTNIHCK